MNVIIYNFVISAFKYFKVGDRMLSHAVLVMGAPEVPQKV